MLITWSIACVYERGTTATVADTLSDDGASSSFGDHLTLAAWRRRFPSSAMYLHGVRHMRGASGVLPRRLRLPHAPALSSGCVVVSLHDIKWTCFAPSRARCMSVCYAIERHTCATFSAVSAAWTARGAYSAPAVEKRSRTALLLYCSWDVLKTRTRMVPDLVRSSDLDILFQHQKV
jgi:hypothetical protein